MKDYYASTENAERFEELRFHGPFGRWLRCHDEELFVRHPLLQHETPQRILEVGAGTGRLTLPFCLRWPDSQIVACDASPAMLAGLEKRTSDLPRLPRIVVADAQQLPFDDQEFDLVFATRLLMHLPDWHSGVRELCRVSRRWVLFDFPPTISVGGLARSLKFGRSGFEAGYVNLPLPEVLGVLRASGFTAKEVRRQFVLPLPVHLKLALPPLSLGIETAFACCGLRRILGAPIFIAASRN